MKQQEDFEVQSLVFTKEKFPKQSDATAWAEDHGFKSDKVDETEDSWRLRQFDPDTCVRDTHRSWELDEGVTAVGCKVREGDAVGAAANSGKAMFMTVKAGAVNVASRTVEGWASIEEVDRQGDLMLATAFEKFIDRFKVNPVLCWCHNIFAPPIGQVPEIEIVPEKGLRFVAKFATTKFAMEILQLFKEKVLRAFSVQFIPHELREPNDAEKEKHGASLKQTIAIAELLEISPVPVPAVVHALAGKAKTLDVNAWEAFTLSGILGFKDGEAPADDDGSTKADPKAAFEAIKEAAATINDLADQGLEGLAEGEPADEPGAEPPADEPPPDEEVEALSGVAQSIGENATEASGRLGSSADGTAAHNGG